jgi:hypothetical protein
MYLSPQHTFHLLWSKQNIKSNFAEGKTGLPENAVSALQTSLIGVFISIGGLIAYSYMQEETSISLSASFYLARPTVMTYGVSLLLKDCICRDCYFTLMLIWKNDILLISTPSPIIMLNLLFN